LVDVPPEAYPLVITFHDFLIMLDGTVGNSYFERFHEVRKHSLGKVRGGSVALQTFIRKKEVNYERFSSSYWPHFNTQLTKMLDSSRVFTEIISHIKGGPQALEAGDGKLSGEDYVSQSESRASSLNRQKREIIYEVFQNYEKMKVENGDFDMADLVIDLHRRLRVESYEGDEIHFVYVDEVQDLTLSQIALFKYICKNVEEGFVFSGDTAQTIARGIDFRFQDIRSLFYKKFLLESKSSGHDKRKEKGIISDIFHLSQNFRTHDGVLKLSQSVIELLYHFFPQSIDKLLPETSLVYGEAPILLGSGNNQNTIITIFGNSGKAGRSIVGFGAEQVILVRDDHVQKEITNYVGKQALVLTIVECKGLEFQVVIMRNYLFNLLVYMEMTTVIILKGPV
jgi:superfamily I DNA/RNA helicase